jgi:hypothetical protein
MIYQTKEVAITNKCTSVAGNFGGNADAAAPAQCRAHPDEPHPGLH